MEFDSVWSLWYHAVDDHDWSLASYTHLADITDLESYHAMHNTIPDITAGMFFLMRQGVAPMWEDPANRDGGYWSFRVLKAQANDIWRDLTALLAGGSLTKRTDNMARLTGISFSPKISNAIFRIWCGETGESDAKKVITPVHNLSMTDAIFKRYS